MKAVAILREGAPPEVTDLPVPEPGPDEIRIQIRAAGVNPADGKAASGAFGPVVVPYIPGFDGAGVVEKLGEAVTAFREGDPVFGRLGRVGRGTYAEYVTVKESAVVTVIPAGLDYAQAAAVPVAGLTAYGILEALELPAPAAILILGATGGVGSFLTQFASRAGLAVVATARPQLREKVQALGATHVVDHTDSTPLDKQLAAAGIDELDAIVDLVGDKSLLRNLGRLIRPGGSLVSTVGAADEGESYAPAVRAWNYSKQATKQQMEELAAVLQGGEIVIPVERVLDLAEGPRVLQESLSGHLHGKTVLEVSAEG